ncbi:MAG: hypothetical protein Q4A07_13470 [Coriobacteriales bacterium]|nr:hypothetical protein [Coriobacteriales bacterium]
MLYANAAWRGDDELGSLMADFCQSDPSKIRDGMVVSLLAIVPGPC